eukprot:TRINITY_DN29149_c0_g1_i1.p1 TRINITY_DN29149_c0_g1~~TRINITY_DN29149_c0_g1_i1.p1  ORF type:complete len:955 (-),score=120.26 TRINITY_DN29149_c0_g1_i1:245-3109(-)
MFRHSSLWLRRGSGALRATCERKTRSASSSRAGLWRLPWSHEVTLRRAHLSPVSCARKCASTPDAGSDRSPLADIEQPTRGQLKQLFVASAIPFVGFGFFDNFVMIVAGDFIDSTMCVTFCFSTMAAAAVGNTVSDVVGIYAGGVVEQAADKMGIREPPLTSDQRLLPATKVWQYTGQVLGIVFGCFLGACPLLFLDLNESTRLKREKELIAVLTEAMPDVERIMDAEAILLMAVDEESQMLKPLSASKKLPEVKPWAMDKGIMGHVAKTGRFVNIADVKQTDYFHGPMHKNFQGSNIEVKSILCVPVLSGSKVVGVLGAINKADHKAFDMKDEDHLSFIASHVSVRMESALGEGESFTHVILTCERVLGKQESYEYGSTARQRRAELYLPALHGITRVLQAQATTLMLLDQDSESLVTEAIHGELPKHKNKLGEGIAGQCAVQGRVFNVLRDMDENASSESLFDRKRHDDYLGSGISVWSELCVPMFDSQRKCLGVIKVINKQGGKPFNSEDIAFTKNVALNLGIMLEDDGGIKRVLALARQQLQNKQMSASSRADYYTVLLFLEKAQNLHGIADYYGSGISPYVTVRIVEGDPTKDPLMGEEVVQQRIKDRKNVVRKFAKSSTKMQTANPSWEETIAVQVPIHLRNKPSEDLYCHVLLWDYVPGREGDALIGQCVINLASVPMKLKATRPFHLQPIPGKEDQDLNKSMLWLSFSRGPKPMARAISPGERLQMKENGDDWAGDLFVPKVGLAAVEDFESSDDWLQIADRLRDSLINECGVTAAEVDRLRTNCNASDLVFAISDPGQLDCPLVFVSKSFEDLTGYPRSFALGRNCRFLQPKNRTENDMANLADCQRMRQFVQGQMPEGYVLWNLLLNETNDGKKFWNLLRMEFVHVGEEQKPYICAVQREFRRPPTGGLPEVSRMRERLAEHERNRTVPTDVLEWAGLLPSVSN